MSPRPPLSLLALALVVGAASCARLDARTAPSPWRDGLVAMEEERAALAMARSRDADEERFDPEGLYIQGDTLWVWSHAHAGQVGLREDEAGTWRPVARREGPVGTTRCTAFGPGGEGSLCVGDREPGGLAAFGRGGFRSELPARGGFRDVVVDRQRGLVHVLDGVDHRLWTLDDRGEILGVVAVAPGPRRAGRLGDDALWVLHGTAPRLTVVELDGEGLPRADWTPLSRTAPARDATHDPARDLLWLVGPEDRRVRRDTGPVRGLRSEVTAHRAADLRRGMLDPVAAVDLGAAGLVDGTRLVRVGERLVVSASGNDRVGILAAKDPGWQVVGTAEGGLRPAGLLVVPDGFWVAGRLDDTVTRFALSEESEDPEEMARVELDPAPRDRPRDLGERLFYGTFLWGEAGPEAITCNSCHWETGTDHRVQPGFRERRWEVTRPLGGVGAVRPIFSTNGAGTLTDALEGLVRGLDPRFWTDRHAREPWWEEPLRVPVKGGEVVTLDPREIREALIAFLTSLPTPRPLLRAESGAFSESARRGWELFARDCLSCHQAAPDLRHPERIPKDEVLAHLRERALTFGAPAWARTGVEPSFHANGNRITPLVDLGRGGPYFTNGSARTLRDVLERARPGTDRVHGGRPGEPPTYTEAELEALRAFLLSL